MYRLFGLTASERKALEPLPPGASIAELENRLIQLDELRYREYVKFIAQKTTVRNLARYEIDATRIGIRMEVTALRIKTARLRSPGQPLSQKVHDLVTKWSEPRS